MNHRQIVSPDEWLAARKRHLTKEKELTRLRDELSAERREMPRVKVEKECYGRGGEEALGASMLLDMTPMGRNESGPMDWVRRHDEYEEEHKGQASAA